MALSGTLTLLHEISNTYLLMILYVLLCMYALLNNKVRYPEITAESLSSALFVGMFFVSSNSNLAFHNLRPYHSV